MKTKTYCAIYTRKSTSEGLDSDFSSLDSQREACQSYIKSQQGEGWVSLPAQYDDGGFTGANTDRPALTQLLDDIKTGRVNCVVVYKVDRLSRSLLDFAKLLEFFDKYNVPFVSVTQHFNTQNSMGRLTLNILLSFAQFEREIISERTRDKISAARKKGKWTGAIPVLGYNIDSENKKLVPNTKEAETVKFIYETYLQQKSVARVVDVLNERGIKTKEHTSKKGHLRGGFKFRANLVYRILSNVSYIGKVKYKGQVYEGEQPGILPQELFDKVQDALKENNGMRKNVKNKPQGALLRHLLRCKICGAAMSPTYASKKNKKYRYYICQTALRQGYDKCATKTVNANDIEVSITGKLREEKILDKTVWDSLISIERRNYLEDKIKSIYYSGDNIDIMLRSGESFSYAAKLRKVWRRPKVDNSEKPKIPHLRKNLVLAYQISEYIEKNKMRPKAFAKLANVASSRIYWLLSLLLLAPKMQESILNLDLELNEKQINTMSQQLIWSEQNLDFRQCG